MLKKEHRLAKTKDIQFAFLKGRSFFNPVFAVKFVKKPSPVARFTVVVSTKVSKNATARNKIKRVAREYIRQHLPEFPAGDYVVTARNAASGAENKTLVQKLSELLSHVVNKKT